MNYQEYAIMWDVDGTLADSEPIHDLAMIETLKQYGIEINSTDEVLGMNRKKVHEYLCANYQNMPSYQDYVLDVDRYYFENRKKILPMQNAVDKCLEFAQLGLRQAAVSNSEPNIVATTIEQVGVKDCFNIVITCDGLGKPKPHSDPYLRALDALNVKKENAIIFEDSKVGCEAARNAGIFVIGVSKFSSELGANIHVEEVPNVSLEELFAMVK